jgi:hypothetical protein
MTSRTSTSFNCPARGLRSAAALLLGLLPLLCAARAHAVSCTTQAEMKGPERMALLTAARGLAAKMQANDINGVKADTLASVASRFDGIASTISGLVPDLQGSSLAVTSLYDLDAKDAEAGQDAVQFFCGEAANAGAHVIFNIPGLPAGHFAFAVVEATGVKKPERLTMLLSKSGPQDAGSWQLAGFFPRPLTSDGHDGVWYWQRARGFAKAGETWNAYFYYQTALYLLIPAEFLSSNNSDKLIEETQTSTPPGLPGEQPMSVTADGAPISITNIRTDSSLGGYDLVVSYQAADVSNPVAARAKTVALMKALLALHPEWKQAFHGLWVFANAPNQQPFSLELAMPAITSQS